MLQENFIRFQLNLFKPFASSCSLKLAREGQDKLGELFAFAYKNDVKYESCTLDGFEAVMISPEDELTGGIILYLHGGGYTCGDIKYAKGFGTTLASKCGIKVFCPAYRLAPESVFPAAVDDALASYKYLITLGFAPADIILCGESAGGGLAYSLCLKLKELGYTMPAGIIAASPWSDLTMSGESYQKNADNDPSMELKRLEFYANCYVHGKPEGTEDMEKDRSLKKEPLLSPLFGDLTGLPPSLLFVGGDEIMLDDTVALHKKLLDCGCRSKMIIRKKMWHAYVLYCLKENESDFDAIEKFISRTVSKPKKLRWMRLDNAAKIYPAIKTRRWNNFFRLSATLNETVDKSILKSALDVTVRRFPSIAVRLRRGFFWYYLQEVKEAPEISDEEAYPLKNTPFDDIRECAFRVIAYQNRIAVEFFHAITDGNGGLVFLKTLVAEYIFQKYGETLPFTDGVLDRLEEAKESEIEDSFLKYTGRINADRGERRTFMIEGTPEPDDFCTNTNFIMDADEVIRESKKRGVTVTSFLTAALIAATISIQNDTVANKKHHKDVRILLPVNLRSFFKSDSLRNFVLFVIAGVDVRLGDYSLDELCEIVYHQLKLELTEKEMQKRISVNVNMEQKAYLKVVPLFIKNLAMKAAFNLLSENKSCFSFSNLGVVKAPEKMKEYVKGMDFILGVQARAPYNVGVLTYNGRMYMNFIRNIKEPLLEQRFYEVLHSVGIHVLLQSNCRD